jgi:hypothetical protein
VRKVNREASVNMASAGIRLVLRTLVSDGPELAGKLCDVLDLTEPRLSPRRQGQAAGRSLLGMHDEAMRKLRLGGVGVVSYLVVDGEMGSDAILVGSELASQNDGLT